jgi:hypothetical protein
MKKIWSEVAGHSRDEQEEKRRQLRHEREEQILALVRPEDREKYDAVMKSYSDQMAAMDKETRAGFARAVEQTKQLLTPEQRTKYEEILSHQRFDRGGPRGGGPGGPGGPPGDRGGDRGSGPRDRETTRRGDFGGGATPKPSTQP